MLAARPIVSIMKGQPARKDVVRELLNRLIENNEDSAWASFVVVSERGWFGKHFDNLPWIEVLFVDQQSLQLNIGLQKSTNAAVPSVPEKWKAVSEGLLWKKVSEGTWTVPVGDVEELIDWIDKYLAEMSIPLPIV